MIEIWGLQITRFFLDGFGNEVGSMGRYEEVTEAQRDVKQKYEIALDIYHQGKFESALENFEARFKAQNDRASEVLAERCEQLLLAPPKNWTGVHTLSEK